MCVTNYNRGGEKRNFDHFYLFFSGLEESGINRSDGVIDKRSSRGADLGVCSTVNVRAAPASLGVGTPGATSLRPCTLDTRGPS